MLAGNPSRTNAAASEKCVLEPLFRLADWRESFGRAHLHSYRKRARERLGMQDLPLKTVLAYRDTDSFAARELDEQSARFRQSMDEYEAALHGTEPIRWRYAFIGLN